MPVSILPTTTDNESKAARLLRLRKLVTGEVQGTLPAGLHAVIVKTASIYDNPTTGKRSYRCDCEVVDGVYAGCTTLVFTSASDDARLAEMARVLGMTSEAELGMFLDNDPSILRAMQGKQAGIVRKAREDKPSELTNNWVPRA